MGHYRRIDIAHIFLIFSPCSDQFIDVNGAVMKIGLRHIVHPVADLGVEQIVCNHCVKKLPFHLDAVVPQLQDIVFDVLPYFLNLFILEERLENLHLFLRFIPVGSDGYIVCLPLTESEGETYQFTQQRIKPRGLGIEADRWLR